MSKRAETPLANRVELALADGQLAISGHLSIDTVQDIDRAKAPSSAPDIIVIDLSGLTRMDTAGAWFVLDIKERARAEGRKVAFEGATPAQAQLIETVRQCLQPEKTKATKRPNLSDHLETYGRMVVRGVRKTLELTSFLGQVMATMAGILLRPRRLRLTSLVHHCQEVGVNAVPIVALMAFLIGVVLAFQGSAQLRQFGAEVFVVDSDRDLDPARTGDLADRDHRRGAVGVCLYRRHRLDEDARRDRRDAHAWP